MTEKQSHTDDCTEMGTLAEGHKRFTPFVGTFSAQVKLWMGPGDPLVSTGVMRNELELGGRFLRQTYRGDQASGPFPDFEGRGYWGYNTVTHMYEGFWIDTAATFMQTESGNVDSSGKVWTMIGSMTDPQTGKPMQKRSVITLKDDDHNSIQMYFKTPDGQEFKTMEIEYTRTE